MLFNSYTFIFLFLPVVLAGFLLLGGRFGKQAGLAWLIASSVVFYASWEPIYTWLLVLSVGFNFVLASQLHKAVPYRKTLLTIGVVANVLLLLYYKTIVAGFFSAEQNYSAAFSTTRDVLIPLGISFITFQQIAYLVDTYKGRLGDRSLLQYSLFITFFPQLVMGPIIHYREMAPQLNKPGFIQWNSTNITLGLAIFSVGLFKKVVLADGIAPYVNNVYDVAQTGVPIGMLDAWLGSVGFQFQIYFDFSGYADMAIGIARMFNINLPINFDSPYRAGDRFDLWRRWHVSFGAFMRQYVFFPLARAKFLKLGTVGALLITTLISGFWHGLGWTFIIWGGAQGLIMLFSHYRRQWRKRTHFGFTAIFTTFFTTLVLGVLFRSKDLDTVSNMVDGMIGRHALGLPVRLAEFIETIIGTPLAPQVIGDHLVTRPEIPLLVIMAIVIWALPNTQRIFRDYWSALDQRANRPSLSWLDKSTLISSIKFKPSTTWAFLIAALVAGSLLFMNGSSRFIYFQF